MRGLDLVEIMMLVLCAGLGLVWTAAGVAAYTINVPPPALDPLGLLRGLVWLPFGGALWLTSQTARMGWTAGDDLRVFALTFVWGALAGLLVGLALVLLNRHREVV